MGTLLVHRKLASVADAAARDRGRPWLAGVHVTLGEDGRAQVEATDGGALIRVTDTAEGKDTRRPTDFPVIEGFTVSQNGSAEGIIPADSWRKFFKSASFPKRTFSLPMLQHAAITLDKDQALLAATDLASPTITRTAMLEGPYPKVDTVFPTEEPAVTFFADPALLAATLASVAKLMGDGRKVRIDIYDPTKPIKITAQDDEEGYVIEALVAPTR